jgi:hypothetical protein
MSMSATCGGTGNVLEMVQHSPTTSMQRLSVHLGVS